MTRRVPFLDVLRGVAILGILPVNAWAFFYPSVVWDDPAYPPGDGGGTSAVFVVRLLFQSKLITLFALLFGVGLGVQWLRARAAARPFAPRIVRRLLVLLALGALHATLLWYGDILFVYALLGLVAACFVATDRAALAWFGGLAIVPTFLFVALLGLAAALTSGADPGLPDTSAEAAVFSAGTFADMSALRASLWGDVLAGSLLVHGPRLGGLMLIGIALAKCPRWLSPEQPDGRRLHRRIALVLVPAGLALEAGAAWASTTQPGSAAAAAAEIVHQIGSLALAGGMASVVALSVPRAPAPLAAIGRTALSCYIGQTLIMTTLSYSYGLALFGRPTRWELMGIVVLVWGAQALLAAAWLTRFESGPLEWLWRAATNLAPPRFLRRRA